jgi:hypothetical protein
MRKLENFAIGAASNPAAQKSRGDARENKPDIKEARSESTNVIFFCINC